MSTAEHRDDRYDRYDRYDRQDGVKAPVARLLCRDERLFRFFEIELAHWGIEPETTGGATHQPDREPPPCLIIADTDEWEATALLSEAAALGCPLLAFGQKAADIPAEAGAYLRRPFPLPVLEGILCRLLSGATTAAAPPTPIPLAATPPSAVPDALSLTPEGDAARIGDRRIPLTPTEVALLGRLLAHRDTHAGEPVSREELARLIGGGGNSVDVYVCHLRRKLEKPLGRRMITTVRGRGYVLE